MTVAARPSTSHSTAAADLALSNAELVRRLRTDLHSAAPILYHRYEPRIRWLVRRMMGPDPDQSDVVQQVFFDLLRSGFNIREPEKLPGWIHSFTVCAVYKERRRRRARRALEDAAADGVEKDLVRDVEARDLLARTLALMDHLPQHERAALTMRVMEGRTCDDIARLVGCSTPTVKRRLARANHRLLAMMARNPELVALVRTRRSRLLGALFGNGGIRLRAQSPRSN
jgi:RNA polymerase sigma factor (sigma-70 family)